VEGVTVEVRKPFVGRSLSITGSAKDFGVMQAVSRGDGYYEPNMMQFIATVVRRGSTCLDVGANIGILTCAIAECCAPGKVYAFEPGSQSCEWLRANVEANDCSNVTVVQSAVYSCSGVVELHGHAEHPGGEFISETDATDKTHEAVRAVTIDEFVATARVPRVDFIKLDVEGSELHALDGARRTIERCRPILVVECNPLALGRFQHRPVSALFGRLADLYGKVGYLGPDGAVHRLWNTTQLNELLINNGVVDLVAGVRFLPRRATQLVMYAIVGVSRTWFQRASSPPATPPACAFAINPSFEARFDTPSLTGSVDELTTVPIHLRNTSNIWYDSHYADHAIVATYRLRRGVDLIEDDGVRTLFEHPIAPGAEATVPLAVRLPPEPGQYTLEFTLVQEAFAWFDDIDPALRVDLPIIVNGG
jgi:FkbM family methyltransferase